jgi:hypothetical protein
MRLIAVSACCLALAASAIPRAYSPKFHCDASESANAVYHLACLAGNIPCTKPVFERFWRDKLQLTAADQSEFDAWTAIMTKVANAAPPPKPAPYIGNTRTFYPDVDAQHSVIRAAVESRSLSDFQRRARSWLNGDDAARLQIATERVRERLRPWWQAIGQNAVKGHLGQVHKKLRSQEISQLAGEVAGFVEADRPARDIYFHAIPGPESDPNAANATFVWNHCFMEVIASATPDAIASVGMHELTHYLYDTAPAARHAALMQQFDQAEVPHASALYALLNEAIACAVQGLLAERTPKANESKADDDGYPHSFIKRLCKSTVPVLSESLAKRSTLYQGFSPLYIRESNRELGDDVRDPKFFLVSAAILPTDTVASAYDVYLRELQPVTYIRSDRWRLFPYLNLVLMFAHDELRGLSTAFPEVGSYTNKRGFAYMGTRQGKASVCILSGRDAAAVTDVVKAFAKLTSVPPSGLVLSID